jgi:hypothetical protein
MPTDKPPTAHWPAGAFCVGSRPKSGGEEGAMSVHSDVTSNDHNGGER